MGAQLQHSKRSELDDIIECAICTETYTNPRSLPCLHTFCLKCIERWGENKQPGDDLECPTCKHVFPVPGEGIKGLPKNFDMEKMKLVKEQLSVSALCRAYCDACSFGDTDTSKKKQAIVNCIQCQGKLCRECDDVHETQKSMKLHLRQNIVSQSSQADLCETHGREIRMFCIECKDVICKMCVAASHRRHECVNISNIVDEFRHQMSADIKVASGVVDNCISTTNMISSDRQTFIEQIEKTEQAICNRAEELKRAIDCQKLNFVSELMVIKQERLKHVGQVTYDLEQHVSLLKTLNQRTEELFDSGSGVDIAREKYSLHERNNELLKINYLQRAVDDLGSVAVSFAASFDNDDMISRYGRIDVKKEPGRCSLRTSACVF